MKQLLFILSIISVSFPLMASHMPAEYNLHNHRHYTCDGLIVAVALETNAARVVINRFAYVLPQTPSASGALYQNDLLRFWDKGETALLSYSDDQYVSCNRIEERI